ncbi:hypothetical protein Tco_1298919, partial [Tanacetum coccineum]
MRLTKRIADFGNGTITIYLELDPFLDSSDEEEKIGDDWDLLLDDLDFGDIPDIEGFEIPTFKKLKERHWPSIYAEDIIYWRRKDQEALIEKEDPGAFMIPIRLKGKINLNALADTGSDINVMPCLQRTRQRGGVTTIIAKFLIQDMPIDRDTLILVGRGFLHTCGSILNTIERIIILYRVDSDDFYENCDELWFIVINNPFWK